MLVDRVGAHRLMIVGITFSTLGMLWLTQLGEHSGYVALVGPLVVFGLGNGLAFVPLTTAALDGVDPRDAGAASGLVNVMQQLGGSLGLAVLVTVFGSGQHARRRRDLPAGLSPRRGRAAGVRHRGRPLVLDGDGVPGRHPAARHLRDPHQAPAAARGSEPVAVAVAAE